MEVFREIQRYDHPDAHKLCPLTHDHSANRAITEHLGCCRLSLHCPGDPRSPKSEGQPRGREVPEELFSLMQTLPDWARRGARSPTVQLGTPPTPEWPIKGLPSPPLWLAWAGAKEVGVWCTPTYFHQLPIPLMLFILCLFHLRVIL